MVQSNKMIKVFLEIDQQIIADNDSEKWLFRLKDRIKMIRLYNLKHIANKRIKINWVVI